MIRPMDAYIRVSRVGGREGDAYRSPEIQRATIENWARSNDIELGRIVVEEDVPGSRAPEDRGLGELLRRAEEGASDGVMVYKIDRFGRDLADVAVNVKRLRDAGARLVGVSEGVDSSTDVGALIIAFLAGLGEYQLNMIRAGWARATAAAVEQSGIHITAGAPLGYLRADGGKRGDVRHGRLTRPRDPRLVRDPETADAVREAFEMRAGGASHGDVVKHLRGAGCPITKSSVTAMLENRVYLGEARGPNGVTNADAHQALVSEDVFERVRARKGARQHRDGSLTGQAMLGGVARCAGCGHKLRVQGSTNARTGEREASYVCAARYAGGDCPAPAAARVKVVDEHVIGVLAGDWDEVTATVQSAERRYIEAREAMRRAEETLNAWVDDADLYVQLGQETFRRGVLARQRALDGARGAFYDLDDPGIPEGATVLHVDGVPYVYEIWGADLERDRRLLRSVIAEVKVAKADPKRRRWQPIAERVEIRWVGEKAAEAAEAVANQGR
jgi:site-specific DNA recombinase